jgi:protein SCO1/2
MNRLTKTGILLLMLVVPVFLFLYLRFFGENHYTLPRFFPLVDSATGTVRMGANSNRQWYELERDTVFHRIPAFQLLSQDSTPVSEAQTRDRIRVVNFFSTNGDAGTARRMAQLARLQEVFYDQPAVLLLSHTLDPRRDTPGVLPKYAADYDPQAGKWLFLTGDSAQLASLRTNGYRLTDPAAVSTKTLDAGETIRPNDKLVLVDKSGVIRGYYDGTDKKDVDRLILEIRVLLRIDQKKKS